MQVNRDRLWSTLMRSAEIGKGRAGGLSRLTLTEEDRAVRDELRLMAAASGLPVAIDAAGNMFVRLEGEEDGPPVLMGSHLDTQVAGGRFDGILGVLAGLEVLRTLKDAGHVPRRPIEVVNWTNEEGARFSPPMMASAVFSGVQTLDWLYDRRDDEGVRFLDALDAIGYRGEVPVGKAVDAYFELHIEQGPDLYDEGLTAGIVTGSYAVHGMLARFTGETAHTGPTPMARRRNALVAACNAAALVDDVGHRHAPIGKATVARLTAWPNKPGILSSDAELTVDVRHADHAIAAQMAQEMEDAIVAGAQKANVEASIADRWGFGDEAFDPDLTGLLRTAAQDLGVSHRDILSQAGHDAYYVSRTAPTAMLFSPCIDGITHNEAEDVEREPTMDCADVLLRAVLARADR